MEIRFIATLVASLATLMYSTAQAQSVTTERFVLEPSSDGTIYDQFPFNGLPDFIQSEFNQVQLEGGEFDARSVIKFDLSSIPSNKRIVQATLVAPVYGKGFAEGDTSLPIEIRGFATTGDIQLDDFHAGQFVGLFDGFPIELGSRQRIDATAVVRSVFKSERTMVGFVLRTTGRGGLILGSAEFAIPTRLAVITKDAL
jgi:hypothetical protein